MVFLFRMVEARIAARCLTFKPVKTKSLSNGLDDVLYDVGGNEGRRGSVVVGENSNAKWKSDSEA